MSNNKPTIVPVKWWFLILGLGTCLAIPTLATAGSATLCVNGKYGNPKKVIFSGSCKPKEIAVPLPPTFGYKIGDTGPGGGIIFFVDYNDQFPSFDYLEAAPVDLGPIVWCDNTNTSIPTISAWAANAVGAGQANTTAMLGVCISGAAVLADNYISNNGTSDWFLPSEGELMMMYTNLRQAGRGAFSYNAYWSSTQYSADDTIYAWYQTFLNGFQALNNMAAEFSVRPVRAF